MLNVFKRIPISIHPFFYLMAIALGWFYGLTPLGIVLWVFVVTFSVIVHELGHALTALFFERKVKIELTVLGGVTYQSGRLPLKLWQEFLLVLNGPLAGFFLFLGAFHLRNSSLPLHPYIATSLDFAIFINLYWNLLNLLPIFPLDGGKLLSISMEAIFGVKGMKFSYIIACVFGAGLGVALMGYGNLLGGSIFFMLAFESYQSYVDQRDVSNADRDEDLILLYDEAKTALRDGNHHNAYSLFEKITEKTIKGRMYIMSILHMSFILSGWGESKKAYDLLLPIKDQVPEESIDLLHHLAYYNKDFPLLAELGDLCYQEHPSSDVAFQNAVAHASLGNVKASVGWLQCARSEAMPDIKEELKKTEFDSIRHDPLFEEFEKLLEGTA